jgi:general stress protein 26
MSDDSERVWDLMERFPVCTLTIWDGVELRSRPMAAFVRRRNDAIYFLADAACFADEALRAHPGVSLTFADPASDQIASVAGVVQASADPLVIRDLWATSARQQWDSPDHPDIRMLRVMPQRADLWDGAAKSVRTVPLAMRATGRPADSGTKSTR